MFPEDHWSVLDLTTRIQMVYPELHHMLVLRCLHTTLQHFKLEILLMKLYSIPEGNHDLNIWDKSNSMTIYPAKTELMLLSESSFTGAPLGPNKLNFLTKSTCLGVQLDTKLSWSPHIKSLCKSFSARLKKLQHLKGFDYRILE